MQTAIAENSRTVLDQNGYNRRYVDLTEMYNTIKADYDKISEQIESKKAQRVFIVKYKCRKLQTKNVGRCNYIL